MTILSTVIGMQHVQKAQSMELDAYVCQVLLEMVHSVQVCVFHIHMRKGWLGWGRVG